MGLMSLITAIIGLPAQLNTLLAEIKNLNAMFQKAQDEKWFQKSAEAHQELNQPGSSSEVKKDAAKKIGELIRDA